MKGFLHKNAAAKGQDKVRGGWQERWFELKDEVLYYYAKKDDKLPKGHIQIRGAKISAADETTGKLFSLRIQQARPIFNYLQCKSKVEQTRWLQALRFAAGEFFNELDEPLDKASTNGSQSPKIERAFSLTRQLSLENKESDSRQAPSRYSILVTSHTMPDLNQKDHVFYKLTIKGSGEQDRAWSIDCRFHEQEQIQKAVKNTFPISAAKFPKRKGWFKSAQKRLGMSTVNADAAARCKALQQFWDSLMDEISNMSSVDIIAVQYVYEFLGVSVYERMLQIELEEYKELNPADKENDVYLDSILPSSVTVMDLFGAPESAVEYARLVDPEMLRMTEIAISTRSTWFLNHFLLEVNPHTIAAAMKSVFLMRPTPIVPEKHYNKIMKDARAMKSETGQRAYKSIVNCLGPDNYNTLKRLCDMCSCMTNAENEMKFLAYVFVDGVLKPDHLLERAIALEVLENLMIYFDEVIHTEIGRQQAEEKVRQSIYSAHSRARAALSKAIVERDLEFLKFAITQAEESKLDPMEAALLCAKKILSDLEDYKAQLRKAVIYRSVSQLEKALSCATDLGLNGKLESASLGLLEHLKDESVILIDLKAAMESREIETLNVALKQAEAFKMKTLIENDVLIPRLITTKSLTHPLVDQAVKYLAKLHREYEAIGAIDVAMADRDWKDLEELLESEDAAGTETFEEASKLLSEYHKWKIDAKNAIEANSLSSVETALETARDLRAEGEIVRKLRTLLKEHQEEEELKKATEMMLERASQTSERSNLPDASPDTIENVPTESFEMDAKFEIGIVEDEESEDFKKVIQIANEAIEGQKEDAKAVEIKTEEGNTEVDNENIFKREPENLKNEQENNVEVADNGKKESSSAKMEVQIANEVVEGQEEDVNTEEESEEDVKNKSENLRSEEENDIKVTDNGKKENRSTGMEVDSTGSEQNISRPSATGETIPASQKKDDLTETEPKSTEPERITQDSETEVKEGKSNTPPVQLPTISADAESKISPQDTVFKPPKKVGSVATQEEDTESNEQEPNDSVSEEQSTKVSNSSNSKRELTSGNDSGFRGSPQTVEGVVDQQNPQTINDSKLTIEVPEISDAGLVQSDGSVRSSPIASLPPSPRSFGSAKIKVNNDHGSAVGFRLPPHGSPKQKTRRLYGTPRGSPRINSKKSSARSSLSSIGNRTPTGKVTRVKIMHYRKTAENALQERNIGALRRAIEIGSSMPMEHHDIHSATVSMLKNLEKERELCKRLDRAVEGGQRGDLRQILHEIDSFSPLTYENGKICTNDEIGFAGAKLVSAARKLMRTTSRKELFNPGGQYSPGLTSLQEQPSARKEQQKLPDLDQKKNQLEKQKYIENVSKALKESKLEALQKQWEVGEDIGEVEEMQDLALVIIDNLTQQEKILSRANQSIKSKDICSLRQSIFLMKSFRSIVCSEGLELQKKPPGELALHPKFQDAVKQKRSLEAEEKILSSLRELIESQNLSLLGETLKNAKDLGITNYTVRKGYGLLEDYQAFEGRMKKAKQTLDLRICQNALADAEEMQRRGVGIPFETMEELHKALHLAQLKTSLIKGVEQKQLFDLLPVISIIEKEEVRPDDMKEKLEEARLMMKQLRDMYLEDEWKAAQNQLSSGGTNMNTDEVPTKEAMATMFDQLFDAIATRDTIELSNSISRCSRHCATTSKLIAKARKLRDTFKGYVQYKAKLLRGVNGKIGTDGLSRLVKLSNKLYVKTELTDALNIYMRHIQHRDTLRRQLRHAVASESRAAVSAKIQQMREYKYAALGSGGTVVEPQTTYDKHPACLKLIEDAMMVLRMLEKRDSILEQLRSVIAFKDSELEAEDSLDAEKRIRALGKVINTANQYRGPGADELRRSVEAAHSQLDKLTNYLSHCGTLVSTKSRQLKEISTMCGLALDLGLSGSREEVLNEYRLHLRQEKAWKDSLSVSMVTRNLQRTKKALRRARSFKKREIQFKPNTHKLEIVDSLETESTNELQEVATHFMNHLQERRELLDNLSEACSQQEVELLRSSIKKAETFQELKFDSKERTLVKASTRGIMDPLLETARTKFESLRKEKQKETKMKRRIGNLAAMWDSKIKKQAGRETVRNVGEGKHKEERKNKMASQWIKDKLRALVEVMRSQGTKNANGRHEMRFKELSEALNDNSSALTGILRRAKKLRIVKYEGEALVKGPGDDITVSLTPVAYIAAPGQK
eukprot:CAMPEP_0114521646 /NCGR_PEP_ID=MMETSP0109-20121206/20295_1 /TAXON_ID=29199 /ORGANISM="Chlorarachnion reptans, Strain CCCM449" /LENGTH=2205 /DNA_ID=CAMNT_0001702761 /DNA_START=55 /DNA_END=6672 /DNA_ORIENTATION=-